MLKTVKLTDTNADAMLIEAGKLAFAAGKARDVAKTKGATAVDLAVCGLATPGILSRDFVFDVADKSGAIIESTKANIREFMNGEGFKNTDGSAYRAKESAFRSAVLVTLFGVAGDQSPGACNVWTVFKTKAAPIALALASEGMTAAIAEDGSLKTIGGKGERADALRAAADKSTSALAKIAKGGTGSKGTENATREASPSEILKAAYDIAAKVAKGQEANSASALSYVVGIVSLYQNDPSAFQ